jgi:hypothetical protein
MPTALQPAPPRRPAPIRAGTHPASRGEQPARPRRPPARASDRDRGLSLLYLFTAAMAVMVGAVLLAGAVDSWWILVLAAVLLGVTTFAVFAGIMRLLADEGGDDDR